jgi:energy-coupling factor transport system substrate-specific component
VTQKGRQRQEDGEKMERLKRDFNTISLVMIPVAIAINIAIGQLIYTLKVPLYLDSIGTIFVGAVAGPWVGALTGLLSNLIWGLSGLNPAYTAYAPVGMIVGLLAGIFSQLGWFKVWWRAIIAGVITGLVAALISAPIYTYVSGGVTGSGTDVITAVFRNAGFGILPSAFAQGVSSDPLDKAISFFIVWLVVRGLPLRFLDRFSRADDLR